jgi:hypothetical protein
MARDLPAVLDGGKPHYTGRDAKGRFVAGAPPGPGRPANPYARQQVALRVAVLDEVDEGDLRAVVQKLLRLAKLGNVAAVELLFKWVIGPPPTPTHPDFVRAHEFEAWRAQPGLVDELALAERLPADPHAEDPEEGPEPEVEAVPAAAGSPQLQEMLMWAVKQLAEAQARTALPPPPDPLAGWERFAAMRLAWDEQAAVPIDMLYLAYARWCTSHGEPVLPERDMLAWLTARGATVRTGTFSQLQDLVGVRLLE